MDDIVSDVKADDRVIDAIVRADARDDDMVPAGAEIEFLELLFHRRLVKTVMGILFYHWFVSIRSKLSDKLHGGAVVDERVCFAEEGEFGMLLRSHGLNVDDLAVGLAKAV